MIGGREPEYACEALSGDGKMELGSEDFKETHSNGRAERICEASLASLTQIKEGDAAIISKELESGYRNSDRQRRQEAGSVRCAYTLTTE